MRRPIPKKFGKIHNAFRHADLARLRIARAEFELKARGMLLPKFQQRTGKFDKSKKIRATLVGLFEPGQKKPMVCGYLTPNPEAERRYRLSARLKGKKRAWVSFQTGPVQSISKKYGGRAFDEAMEKVADRIREVAKQQGIEVLLAHPGTKYGEQLALKRGYKRIEGTPVLMKELG